jgi:hypothetical protein
MSWAALALPKLFKLSQESNWYPIFQHSMTQTLWAVDKQTKNNIELWVK